jgi:hypothetical protein
MMKTGYLVDRTIETSPSSVERVNESKEEALKFLHGKYKIGRFIEWLFNREGLEIVTSGAVQQESRVRLELLKWAREVEDDFAFTLPAVAERGRRVLGSLKTQEPKNVALPSNDAVPSIVKPFGPGKQLTQAYLVANLFDLVCLKVALSNCRSYEEYANLVRGFTDVRWRGIPVIIAPAEEPKEITDGGKEGR